MLLSLCCTFKSNINMETLSEIRSLHQKYIMRYKNRIIYGGIILNDDGRPRVIHIFMEADDKETAQKIIENDPNFPLYQDVQVEKFIQRIPIQ